MNNILLPIHTRIRSACERASRSPDEIEILAATKTRSAKQIQEYIDAMSECGMAALVGENYVQECEEKVSGLKGQYKKVLIGKLQSNKVNTAVELFDEIESVDRLSLIGKLDKAATSLQKQLPVWLQVNISNDSKKFGFLSDEVLEAAYQVLGSSSLILRGLMTITAYYEQNEDVRSDFMKMARLHESIKRELNAPTLSLSMGMSADFEIAIEEGATRVRLGEAIFGPRQ